MKKKNTSGVIKTPDIAIVGMASFFPDARNLQDYWTNILSKRNSIITNEDFEGYWRREDYFDPDPFAMDKTYADKAGYLPKIDFDLMEYRVPPKAMDAISVVQLYSLYVSKLALEDAGLLDPSVTSKMKEKIGVIFGQGGQGNIGFALGAREEFPSWQKVFKNSGLPKELSDYLVDRFRSLYVEWQPDSFPGFLTNVVSGRVGSCFDLGGTNCTIDAACASSLAAIKMAISELADGSLDAVLTGGINVENSIFSFLCFSKTPALSKTGTSRPYDADSDGMMLGDGLGLTVLKRLEDAERDGNKIYAVIKGIGSSGDGRAKSIFAPHFEGQIKAIDRAYEKAGLTPTDIQLVEGHGTGTAAGDSTEFQSVSHMFTKANCETQSIALGSVKSQIGHTRCAAGAASLIKTALALHNKVLPPTINVDKPNPKFEIEKSPFYINTLARPWIRSKKQSKRRAAMSAFGFGGTNFHVILEEYQNDHDKAYRTLHVPDVLLFTGDTPDALLAECKKKLEEFKSETGRRQYNDFVEQNKTVTIPEKSARLGFCAKTVDEACNYLETAIKQLESKNDNAWNHPRGIYYQSSAEKMDGKVVALFPGQGSQYVNMASANVQNYPEMREVLAGINDTMEEKGLERVSDVLYPNPVFDKNEEKEQLAKLTKTVFAQTAIGGISAGYYKVLAKAGFKPDYTAGHSFGELTALWASGVISDENFYTLAAERGKAMDLSGQPGKDSGAMLAVMAELEVVEELIKDFPEIKVANYNSKNQIVLGGPTEAIKSFNEKLLSEGKRCVLLPVAAAFHTGFVEFAQKPFVKALEKVEFKAPAIPVFANVTGELYSEKSETIKSTLKDQIVNPVKFSHIIEQVYNKGGRVFVEIGPKPVLSKLVGSILKGKEHKVISLNSGPQKDAELQLRQAYVQLRVSGLVLDHLDPYEVKAPLVEKDPKRLTVELNGGFHMNPDTLARRNKALYEPETAVFDGIIEKLSQEKALQLAETKAGSMAEQIAREKAEVMAEQLAREKAEVMAEQLAAQKAEALAEQLAEKKARVLAEQMADRIVAERLKEIEARQPAVSAGNAVAPITNNAVQVNRGEEKKDGRITPAAVPFNFSDSKDFISSQIEAQNAVNFLHGKFQVTNNSFNHMLKSAIEYESQKLGNADINSASQSEFEKLNEVLNLLDMNQEAYYKNHSTFLNNYISVLRKQQSQVHTASSTVSSANSAGQVQTAVIDQAVTPQQNSGEKMSVSSLLNNTLLNGPEAVAQIQTQAPVKSQTAAAPVIPKGENQSAIGLLNSTLLEGTANSGQTAPAAQSISQNSAAPAVTKENLAPVSAAPVQMGVVALGSAQVSQTPAEKAGSAPAGMDKDEIVEKLLGIVSEKTGYPKDMIDLDMDLEADMGIDSIKRVEILGTLFEGQDDDDFDMEAVESLDIDDFRTLRNIISFITEKNEVPGKPAAPAKVGTTAQAGNAPVDGDEIVERLLGIVSEKTGYPKDMIDLDMDLEADMGIDSIKRVEILGTLFEGQDDDDFDMEAVESLDIDDFRTLRNIIAFITNKNEVAGKPAAQTAAPAELPVQPKISSPPNAAMGVTLTSPQPVQVQTPAKVETAAQAGKTSMDGDEFVEKLLGIVSEKTGYPKDMIDLDMDLEADMGIDSIKRVEILGTLFEGQDDDDFDMEAVESLDIDDFRTLRNIISFVTEKAGDAQGTQAQAAEAQKAPVVEDKVQRFAVTRKILAPCDSVEAKLAEGHIWLITNDGTKMCQDLVKELEKKNEKAVILSFPGSVITQESALKKNFSNYTLEELTDEKITQTIKTIESAEGTIGGFIHIQPASKKIESIKEGFSQNDYDIVKTIFFAAKSLKQSLNDAGLKGRASFITISHVDGQLGYSGKTGFSYIGSGLTGLTKSLHREWKDVFCRHIDLDPGFSSTKAVMAVIEELSDPQNEISEVGITKQQERSTLVMEAADETKDSVGKAPGTEDVFFISGGGRGITAKCAVDMAKAYKCRFILAGRTAIANEEPRWAEGVDESNLQAAAISELKRQGEKMTPVNVEKMVKGIMSQREIGQTIEDINSAGGKAVYISADIKDKDQLAIKVADAEKELGKVTGIIHGAGNLADKKIEKKTEADFEVVFGTKIKGLKAILEAINIDQVQYFVLFSSVSGFFGNAGQTDYSLANEVLNKFAYSFKALAKDKDVKSINWGPWDSGMVSPTLKKFYNEKNIQIIPIPVGTQYCVKELSSNLDQTTQTLVCGGVFNPSDLLKPQAKQIVIKRELLPGKNNFLKDHVVGENKVLPATCAASWMVKACEDILPGFKLVKLKDFKVLKGVVFDENVPVKFSVNLTPVDNSKDAYKVLKAVIESESDRKLPNYHFSAELHLSSDILARPGYADFDLSDDNKVTDKLYIDSNGEGILFHGKSFQGVQKVLNITDNTITGKCLLAGVTDKNQGQFKENSFNPYTADVILHNILLFLHQTEKEGALPSAFAEIKQFETLGFDQDFYVSTKIVSRKGGKIISDIYVHDEKGLLFQTWKGIEATITPQLKELFWNK